MDKLAPTAEKLMNPSVQCVTGELSLHELINFFLRKSVNCAPVIGENSNKKELLGFVSQGDALSHLSSQMFAGFPRMPLQVSHIMKRHPVAVMPDTDVFAVASIFNSHGYRHVPVVDEHNQLLGLISRREILVALTEYFDQQEAEYNREHFPPDLHKIINHRFIVSGR